MRQRLPAVPRTPRNACLPRTRTRPGLPRPGRPAGPSWSGALAAFLVPALAVALVAALPAAGGAAPSPAPAAPSSAAVASSPSAAPAAVALPPVRPDGTVTLDRALATRRSVRALSGAPVPVATVAKLLWSAQGVTDDAGHRTVPSARATYPMDVLVLAARVEGLAPGTWRYDPAAHALVPLAAGSLLDAFVDAASGQDWIRQAAAVFVVTGTAERARAKMGDRAAAFLGLEAGLAAQNLMLQVAAQGLGATFVGGFDAAKAASFLGLPPGESVLALVPVGVRK